MNKRNAALIQKQIQESLGVVPARGYVRFVATPEEDVANCGKTVAGELDELDKVTADEVEQGRESSTKPLKSKRLSVRVSLLPIFPLHLLAICTPSTAMSCPDDLADVEEQIVSRFSQLENKHGRKPEPRSGCTAYSTSQYGRHSHDRHCYPRASSHSAGRPA
jgi:hypothetical protein